jgi:3-oxosteroid 1-dehydrogenase
VTEPAAFDFVVVGSGAAGMAGALAAHEAGLRVLVLERAEVVGGTTALSGGALWLPANPRMLAAGIDDSADEALTYLRELTGGRVAEDVLAAYVNTAAEVVTFLERTTPLRMAACTLYADYYPERRGGKPGGRTVEPEAFDGRVLGRRFSHLRRPQSLTLMLNRVSLTAREAHGLVATGWAGILRAGLGFTRWLLTPWRWRSGRDSRLALGNALVAGLWQGLDRAGITIRTNARVRELIRDGNRVVGVRIESGGRSEDIRTGAGVLLACGGYSRDDVRKRLLHGDPTAAEWGASVPEDTGDALDLASALDADTDLLEAAWWMPVFRVPGEDYARAVVLERALPGAIVVGADGRRFVNESAPYEDFVRAMRAGGHAPAWLIVDRWHRRRYPLGPLMPGRIQPMALAPSRLRRRWLARADSPQALAAQIGVDPAGLAETIRAFSAAAARGEDPQFGRGNSAYDRYYADPAAGPNPCLRPLKPPFWAVPLYPGDLGSKGGLRTDRDGAVLSLDGAPIRGLWAAGNAAANPLGDIYPGAGGTIGPAVVFGMRAARSAARTAGLTNR